MRSLWRIAIALTVVAAGCSGKTSPAGPDGGGNSQCEIKSANEKTPGAPYDLNTFSTAILPILNKSCALSGCHDPKSNQGKFTVYGGTFKSPDSAKACAFAESFNTFNSFTDLNNPQNSKVYQAVTQGDGIHPIKAQPADQMTILNYIQAAAKQNGGTTGSGNNCYDPKTFASVQQAFDSTGCTNAACHGAKGTAGGAIFFINANAMPGTQQFTDNLNATQNLTNLSNPNQSAVYVYSGNSHKGSALSPADQQTLLSWIQAAAKACPPNNNPTPNNCVDTSKFNAGVFQTEIWPMLNGTLDYNNPGGTTGNTTGCTRTTCHGNSALNVPGKLYLSDSQSATQNLADFGCFVDLTNPSQSEVLLCPLNAPGCRKYPAHPGGQIFADGTDLNYQRLLAYIYSAAKVSPLDFAFFARRINPIFNNQDAVQGGAQAGLTCADATSCHGVQSPGQPAPNGSNFPILVNANSVGEITTNFVSAGAFASFLTPNESSLFLYPTDQIFNQIGIHHPGGLDFAPDSQFAKDILTWAGGLRPDGNGANKNWLVAGNYNGLAQVTDTTPVDESATDTPKIFDPDGQQTFNNGQWDGLFSNSDTIDLNAEFPSNNADRAAYAVAYIINTTPSDITADIKVSSPDDVEVFAGSGSGQVGLNGAGTTVTADLPAFNTSKTETRLLIKVFQPQNVQNFTFSTEFRDQTTGALLTDQSGELVFTLGPQGGI